ncbi:MAG: lactate utilization protein [Bacteroidales bacterium]|nr:lactate utilization protein [Bacteroidales bacterium]
MNKYYKTFLKDAERVSFDMKHRKTIKFNMSKYDAAVAKGMLRYKDVEKGKQFVAEKKREALKNLDSNLLLFEKEISKRGVEVLWANDTNESLQYVAQIIKETNAKSIVKGKSMTTEEIDFNDFVEELGVKSVETDLGEFIVQVAGEKPYHIVTPAMHKSRKDVNDLFHEKFGMDNDISAEEMTDYVRKKLRAEYQQAEIGVTGANFIIADIGGIAVTENEGNAIMSTSFPKVHIVIAGIEKVIPSFKDISKFWPLLSAHGTGQSITVYNSIFTGLKRENEEFGPEKMYVILLDNKRTELLKEPKQSDVLSCIRCGACLNACPVYRNIGGYTYEATYGGPIGSVISPFYQGFDVSSHLSFACTICGKCTEVCPAKIDLHLLLLHNRNKSVEINEGSKIFGFFMLIYKFLTLRVFYFDIGFTTIKNIFTQNIFKNLFGKRRALIKFKKSFRKTYKSN